MFLDPLLSRSVLLAGILVISGYLQAKGQDQTYLPSPAEEIIVRLDSLTLTDDGGVHISGFKDNPDEKIILPDIAGREHAFLSIFFSHDIEDDNSVSILALPDSSGEWLYIDINNDEDLTNDGPPIHFKRDESELVFWLPVAGDILQKTGRILQRIPRSVRQNPESLTWFNSFTDEEGNLKPMFANMYAIEGKAGKFYFDDRISLRRGSVLLDSAEIQLGVFDWGSNGRFDEEKDVIIIDLDGDGKLQFSQDSTVFKLNEVFSINEKSYKLTYVDRYGRGIRLVEVKEKPTQLYLDEKKELYANQDIPVRKTEDLDSTFWQMEVPTISGDTLKLADHKGKYLLLNVWGEWCGPCLIEFPELVAAYQSQSKDQFTIIGLLQTSEVESAKAVLERYEAEWPQVMLSIAFRDMFDVRSYPTNILILPNGKTYLEAGGINSKFIDKHVK